MAEITGESASAQLNRVHLHRVMIDTPALLNMVKHCRDADWRQGGQGNLMGVLKDDTLMITQTMPEVNKSQMEELTAAMENESQKLMDTNKVGFYLSAHMGLTFNTDTLNNLYKCYKQFKNSVFLIYDISKANYGMNPLHCYRLSGKAIETLEKNANTTIDKMNLVQDKIRQSQLTIQELFEEVPIRIHRSHLLQAFLFDHIQPHMPAFNTNLFKLATPQYLCNHVYQLNEATEELVFEQQRLEQQQRQMMKQQKRIIQKQGGVSNAPIEDVITNKLDLFLLSRQVDELCNQINDCGIPDKEMESKLQKA
ncbi:eukaryotic translation initiation factor 3 subunit h-like [Stylonychia lemnae]|uniref:Eukaryotic translation initiation factor 3 subunit h-like n=1 Tax=Stylonychia lemnae TaxID=5949 RepID=A0A078AFY3_STYLE|nr:eukaryotic translation initiation factor 3 subunit h-like [Stylonychia lemnae]|eukprot:CDW81205.1 eukaryotic translation initiation factor 3 subunit h-like [Stylonychia lemnae]